MEDGKWKRPEGGWREGKCKVQSAKWEQRRVVWNEGSILQARVDKVGGRGERMAVTAEGLRDAGVGMGFGE